MLLANHNDRLKQVTYPGTGSPTVQYKYENATYPYALTGIVDQNGLRYATWAYDANKRASSSMHGTNAETTTFSYNLSGGTGTVTVTNALGKVFVYTVAAVPGSGVGKVTEIQQQASTNTPAATLTRTYNSAGYLASRTDNNGDVTQYQRNSRGLETSRTEAYGTSLARTITTTWSSAFHVPTEIVQPNLTTDYTYDSYGKLTQLTQTDTTTQNVPYSTNGQTRTWTYTYTSSGELSTVTGPLGTGDTVTYTYNTDGSLATITNELSQLTTINTVNGHGQPTEITDPNGIVTDLAYDAMGRLTTVAVDPGSSQAVTSITYDAAGNITQITQPDSSYLAYTYDDAHRVTSVTDNLSDEIDYTYNYASSVTATNVKNSLGTIVKTLSKTYDELDRVLTEVGANSQTTAFGHDKDDNVTSVTDPRSKLYSNAFDALNRLTQNTDPDSYTTQSAYNAKDDVTSVTDERSLQTSYVCNNRGQ